MICPLPKHCRDWSVNPEQVVGRPTIFHEHSWLVIVGSCDPQHSTKIGMWMRTKSTKFVHSRLITNYRDKNNMDQATYRFHWKTNRSVWNVVPSGQDLVRTLIPFFQSWSKSEMMDRRKHCIWSGFCSLKPGRILVRRRLQIENNVGQDECNEAMLLWMYENLLHNMRSHMRPCLQKGKLTNQCLNWHQFEAPHSVH